MAVPTTFPAGSMTGVSVLERPLVQPDESIGTPADAPATDVADENTAFALLKGMLVGLGVPVGAGAGIINTSPHVNPDLLETLGDMSDAPATDLNDANSVIALLKGCCAALEI